MKKTFECYWCKEYARFSKGEYTYPIDQIGGYDNDTGKPICEGCADNCIWFWRS